MGLAEAIPGLLQRSMSPPCPTTSSPSPLQVLIPGALPHKHLHACPILLNYKPCKVYCPVLSVGFTHTVSSNAQDSPRKV